MMKKFLLLCFYIAVVDFSFIDVDNRKSMLVIYYDNGMTDKLLVDKKDLRCHDCIVRSVEQILNYRHINTTQGDN